MSFFALQSIINAMYTDKIDVWRLVDTIDPKTGTSSQQYVQVDNLIDQPCRLSYDKYGQADKAVVPDGDTNPIKFQPVIFVPNEYDIRKGDKLVVRRLSFGGEVLATLQGIAASPSFYPTGKQVYMSVLEI